MNTAPIALFVYNRLSHTVQTVNALQNNTLAGSSDLIIFSDAPARGDSIASVNEVRRYIRTIKGFRRTRIVEREANLGLAESIVDGVTQVCREYGKIIVLEDDLITSPRFLEFMNKALERYSQRKKIWHISGWNYPVDVSGLPQTFYLRVMNCWGWATWADRWEKYEKNPERLISEWSRKMIKRFNLEGANDFWSQVTANDSGKINTWAIFWYATIFEHQGLCLNPARTYVQNIGHDGSGAHCGNKDVYSSVLSDNPAVEFPEFEHEDADAVRLIRGFYRSLRPGPFVQAVARMKKYIADASRAAKQA
jgi:hypothetical protein